MFLKIIVKCVFLSCGMYYVLKCSPSKMKFGKKREKWDNILFFCCRIFVPQLTNALFPSASEIELKAIWITILFHYIGSRGTWFRSTYQENFLWWRKLLIVCLIRRMHLIITKMWYIILKVLITNLCPVV